VSVVWLNGPVGAGKSTLAYALRALVNPVAAVAVLDEDEVRDAMADAAMISRSTQSPNERLAGIARVLSQQGLVVVVAASDTQSAALFWNRANLPGYREVLLRASFETIKHRSRRHRPAGGAAIASALPPRPELVKRDTAPSVPPPPDLTLDMDNPEPPELLAFRVAVLIPEFVIAAAGAANPGNPGATRLRRGA
jgi:hypothetical protein